MALAMGLQNAAMNRIGQQAVSLTYITGTLVRCARQLAEAVTKRSGTRGFGSTTCSCGYR